MRNRRTSSKGRANQMRFAPKGLEICPFCRKNKLISATPLFRLTDIFSSGFPKSEFPKPDSPQKPGTTGIRGGMHRFSFGDFSLHYRAWRSLSQGLPNLSNLHAPYRGSFLKYAGIISSASVYPLRYGSQKCFWVQYTINISLCQSYIVEILIFCILHNLQLAFLYKTT